MTAIRAIQLSATVLVFMACAHARTLVDTDEMVNPSDLTARDSVDLALLTPEQRAGILAALARDSVALEKIGFLDRLAAVNGGYFVTPEDIAEFAPKTISDIFRHVPVVIDPPRAGSGAKRAGQACFATYVNGLQRQVRVLSELDTFISVRDVLAAEVYPPDQRPPAPFTPATRANCTTVALWTRSEVN
jgi:hypothetical protein